MQEAEDSPIEDEVGHPHASGRVRRAEPVEPGPPPVGEPWWHSKLIVALIAVVGASIAPLTTWLSADQQRSLEAERAAYATRLQQEQQQHAARVEFFEKVVTPSIAMTAEARLDTLRYFRAVLSDDGLRAWANSEYEALKALLDERKRAEEEGAEQAAKAADAAERARRGLASLTSDSSGTESSKQAVEPEKTALREIDKNANEAKRHVEGAENARQKLESTERKILYSMPRPAGAAIATRMPEERAVQPPESLSARQTSVNVAPPPAVPSPNSEGLSIAFVARRDYVTRSEATSYFRFTVSIDASAATLARIARVDYLFDHPTFAQKRHSSQDRAARFSVSYLGWGCLTKVSATLMLVDGTSLDRRFDMCALLK